MRSFVRLRTLRGSLLVLGLFVGLFIVTRLISSEPSCQGKGLSAWLRDLDGPSSLQRHQAQEAVRLIGSNAIPVLRSMLHARDLPLKTNLVGLLRKQRWITIPFTLARERQIRAALGCTALGPQSRLLFPDLFELSHGDSFLFNLAEGAVSEMGQAAVEPLCLSLTDKDYYTRELAAGALVHIGRAAKPAQPLLITCLADPYASVRANAARSLARIGVCSQPVIDGLKRAALDKDIDVRCAAAAALEGFGVKEPSR